MKRDPVGHGCHVLPLPDGRYRVVGSSEDFVSKEFVDGEFSGSIDFVVDRSSNRAVVIPKKARNLGASSGSGLVGSPGVPFTGYWLESVYNVAIVAYALLGSPPAVGMFAVAFDLTGSIDPGTGTVIPIPSVGSDFYMEDPRGLTDPGLSDRPYSQITAFTGPTTYYETYPFDGVNGPYDYEYVVWEIEGLRYEP